MSSTGELFGGGAGGTITRSLSSAPVPNLEIVAHELRAPLAAIRLAVTVASAPALTETQRLAMAKIIQRQVDNMSLLVDDLLDVSNVTRGVLPLHLESVLLDEVIDAGIETSRPFIGYRHHVLTVRKGIAGLRLMADRLRLTQVLSNLLINAAKHTDEGGRIVLATERASTHVLIRVKDSGVGIAAEDMRRIFQPSQELMAERRRTGVCSGIGLTLSRRLVELHGGTLAATSTKLGCGGEFVVALPVPLDRG